MGRTLPSITNAFLHEQQSLARFRRALRRTDQRALDDLFGASRHHLAAAAYASHLLPFEIMLLSMLVEEHKLVLHLQVELERLRLLLGLEDPVVSTDAPADDVPSGTLSAVPALPSGMPFQDAQTRRSAMPPARLDPLQDALPGCEDATNRDLHEPSLPPYDPSAAPPETPERTRKWWAGG
jgi:hypothetical protein